MEPHGLPLAVTQSFLERETFTALVAGFAALSAVVTSLSGLAAADSFLRNEDPSDTANAAAAGLAYGAIVGIPVGIWAALNALGVHT